MKSAGMNYSLWPINKCTKMPVAGFIKLKHLNYGCILSKHFVFESCNYKRSLSFEDLEFSF